MTSLFYPDKARTFEEMGDEFKRYEKNFTLAKFSPESVIMCRLDGRAYHSFCKGLEKPFSQHFIDCMKHTCIELGKEFNPSLIYCQSDELTVVFFNEDRMFDGTVQKYISTMAAYASVRFNEKVRELIPSHINKFPTFDCRVYQLPSRQKAFENVVWRQIDAMKNSVSLLATQYFSPKQLSGKSTKQRKEMLFMEKGVSWNDLNEANQYFGRGAFFKRVPVTKVVDFNLSEKQLQENPAIFEKDGVYYINRNEWAEVQVPKLSKIWENDTPETFLIENVFSHSPILKEISLLEK